MDYRDYFIDQIRVLSGLEHSDALERVLKAFRQVPREHFAGKGPWKLRSPLYGLNSIKTQDDDPRHLYNCALIVLDQELGINIGEPSMWARLLARTEVAAGSSILQVGTGTGYYSGILSNLVGDGNVLGFEYEHGLAQKAKDLLKEYNNVEIRSGNGALDLTNDDGPFDLIVAFAGVTHPVNMWLEKLRPNGRLLIPVTGKNGMGAMLLVKNGKSSLDAKTLGPCGFYHCAGARDEELALRIDQMWKDRSRIDGWGLKLIIDNHKVTYEVDGQRF